MIIHAFAEMQADRAHYRTYVAFTKINLPYVAIETGPEEDRIFNGENLLHFIGACIIQIGLPVSVSLVGYVYGNSPRDIERLAADLGQRTPL